MISYHFDPTADYLAAVTYGPDSMAMLDMLLKTEAHIVVCALNYHKFAESDEDFELLKAYCKEKGLRFEGLDANDLPAEKQIKEGESFSDWARTTRYDFFKTMYAKYDAAGLLIAHQQDDLLETYLLQKQRNKQLAKYGLSEISTNMGMLIIRPLLHYSREDLLEYLAENRVPYSASFSRFENELNNPIRRDVIAHMTEIDRENLIAEMNAINSETAELVKDFDEDIAEGEELEIRALIALPPDAFAATLVKFVSASPDHPSLSADDIAKIRKLCLAPQPNLTMKLKGNTYLIKEYDLLTIGNNFEALPYSYVLEKPDVLHTDQFDLDFTMGAEDRGITSDDYPVTIRSALPSDNYVVHGYLESVRQLYSFWKMPVKMRYLWPVFVNKDGKIIYVPRYRTNFREYHTSILKLHVQVD
ncbi:MAG: tRNA lysidine(34) synthetase TilS [Bacilli bacterium]|nr:tRNA lysidine(34) synthetase TilS [Bacilli bacterium]